MIHMTLCGVDIYMYIIYEPKKQLIIKKVINYFKKGKHENQ